jgi:hypothetical protein
MIEQINENVYVIDTLASNQPGYTSVFVIKGRRLAILDSRVSLTMNRFFLNFEHPN